MSTSRETSRDALVTLLTAALVGVGLPAKTVTGSKPDTLTGETPLVSVLSAGSERPRLTVDGNRGIMYLTIHVWVQQATTGWTNAQAEDALDEIESLIAGVIETNRETSNWMVLEYTARTTVLDVEVEGNRYYREVIPIRAQLKGS
jgi:hypothetical protein